MVQMGWETAHVPSCNQGRKELEQNPEIDLVVIDAAADEDCGLKLIGVMKSESRLARVPIIVCGADIDQVMALKYVELGVDNILLLPTIRETFEAKVRKASENGKPRILVVDDEEMIRDLLHDFLRLERYTPLLASSVDAALKIIQSEPVDAIVTDIMMPGKTGIDLLVEVKRDHAHIPVIMITGLSQRFGPRDVIAMGADGYFVKPFHNVELIFTLRKVMGHRERPIGNRVQSSAS